MGSIRDNKGAYRSQKTCKSQPAFHTQRACDSENPCHTRRACTAAGSFDIQETYQAVPLYPFQGISFIFCDLDGTLLHTDKQPSTKTIDYFRQLKKRCEVIIGVASGRAPSSILPLLKRYAMEDVMDVIIANNGVDTIQACSGRDHREGLIEAAVIAELVHSFQGIPDITIAFHNPGVLYATNVTKRVDSILKMNELHLVLDPRKDTSYEAAPRVMLLFDPIYRSFVEEAVLHHPIKGLKGYFVENDIYEFSCAHISKHQAIATYVQQFQCTLKDVMVFGDSGNDIGMLKHCGIGVVMKNADPDILQYGDWVTEYTNDEDGIYEFLRSHEYLLKRKDTTV